METIAQASERQRHGMLAVEVIHLDQLTEQRSVAEPFAFVLSALGKTILSSPTRFALEIDFGRPNFTAARCWDPCGIPEGKNPRHESGGFAI